MFNRFFGNKNNATDQQDGKNDQGESESTVTNLDAEKLKAVIVSLTQAEGIFTRSGYMIEQLDVEFGKVPRLTPHFKQLSIISEEQQNTLLEETADQQLIKFILISLYKSARLQSLFKESEFYYFGMEIDISAVPNVRTIFRRKESIAEVIQLNPEKPTNT